MRLEYYIADLLFRHDGVVVPGFGGFVSNRVPAGVDRVTHVFRPAHKAIGFNPLLRSNDGLLIDYVARVNRLSYELAAARVNTQVRLWNEALGSGADLVISPLGRIYSEAGRTVFMPELGENFERSSFGLGMFHAMRSDAPRLSERNFVAAVPSHVKARKQKAFPWIEPAQLRSAAVFVPLLGFSLGIGLLLHRDVSNPFAESRSGFEIPLPPDRLHADAPKTSSTGLEQSDRKVKEEIPTARVSTEVKEAEETISIPPVAESNSFSEQAETTVSKVALVVGAFRDPANARRISEQARGFGFSPEVQSLENGLHRVVLLGFETRAEAELKLADVRAKLEQSAWILDRAN